MKSFEATVRSKHQVMLSQPRLPTVLGTAMLALREAKVKITDSLAAQLDTTYKNVNELISN